jgi:hypothetical protein
VTVAYAIAGGLIVGALLYAVGLVLDEVAERHRLRRLADDVRRRQLDREHARNGIHDARPQVHTPRQTGKRWPPT